MSYSNAELLSYLDEAASPERMAAIEEELRSDDELRSRVAGLVAGRDAGLHSLGEVWRRRRLTCPTREELGSFLLGVLDKDHAEYIRFHLEVIECRLCAASLEDLQDQHATSAAEAIGARRERYFQSSVGRLGDSDTK